MTPLVRAAEYAIVYEYGARWQELEDRFDDREAAIEEARGMLERGETRAASVQGRGTPELPTPVGEVQVWQGVGATYAPRHFFPGQARDEVEIVAKDDRRR